MDSKDGTVVPKIHGVTAENLAKFMTNHPDDKRLAIVDTRPINEAGKLFPI